MLFLPRGILCTDLLAVDALDREALIVNTRSVRFGTEIIFFFFFVFKVIYTLSSSLARNSTNAAWTSWSTVRPIFLVGGLESSGKKTPAKGSEMKDTVNRVSTVIQFENGEVRASGWGR